MDTDMLSVWKVSPSDQLSDVIIQISEGKKGLVVALEQAPSETLHKVVGIITDGDMRRAMQKYRERFFSLKVEDVMSRNPKKIHQDAKLSEAADLMLSNSIHALIVLDERDQFCGIIDYFTCV
jgi:arabinose-5-phosphate isomerase